MIVDYIVPIKSQKLLKIQLLYKYYLLFTQDQELDFLTFWSDDTPSSQPPQNPYKTVIALAHAYFFALFDFFITLIKTPFLYRYHRKGTRESAI